MSCAGLLYAHHAAEPDDLRRAWEHNGAGEGGGGAYVFNSLACEGVFDAELPCAATIPAGLCELDERARSGLPGID